MAEDASALESKFCLIWLINSDGTSIRCQSVSTALDGLHNQFETTFFYLYYFLESYFNFDKSAFCMLSTLVGISPLAVGCMSVKKYNFAVTALKHTDKS